MRIVYQVIDVDGNRHTTVSPQKLAAIILVLTTESKQFTVTSEIR